MKKTQRTKGFRLVSALLLSGVLLFGMAVTAFAAAGTPDLDFSEEGSITVTLYSDVDQASVTDGALTIYHVADLYLDDGNMAYEYTEDFAGCTASLADPAETSLAAELEAYVESARIGGTTKAIGSDGTVDFTGLGLGLYLVVQTTGSTGYYSADPFVVTVPIAREDGWIYNVDASPKVEVLTPVPEPTTPDTTPTPSGSTLPQTGKLVWPIPILAAAGVLFCIAGVRMRRKGSRIHA